MGTPEPLMHRMVKYLAVASSMDGKDGKSNGKENLYIQEMILKLLIIWLVDCPVAVECFLDAHPHITYLLELLSNQSATVCTRGLAAVLLGECALYNKCIGSGKDAFGIVDAISQKPGLTSYFLKFDEMDKTFLFSSRKVSAHRKPLTRSSGASVENVEDAEKDASLEDKRNTEHPILAAVFDASFVAIVVSLEGNIRERFVEIYSNPKAKVAIVPAELEQRSGESEGDYISRLKSFIEKQCLEIQVN